MFRISGLGMHGRGALASYSAILRFAIADCSFLWLPMLPPGHILSLYIYTYIIYIYICIYICIIYIYIYLYLYSIRILYIYIIYCIYYVISYVYIYTTHTTCPSVVPGGRAGSSHHLTECRVADKELNLSYHDRDTCIYIYTYIYIRY